MQIVTQEILEVFAPEHGRPSCSDTNRCNGLDSAYIHGTHTAECNRCALLEILYELDGEVPKNFVIVTHVELKIRHDGAEE